MYQIPFNDSLCKGTASLYTDSHPCIIGATYALSLSLHPMIAL